jgi:hypothetical protein
MGSACGERAGTIASGPGQVLIREAISQLRNGLMAFVLSVSLFIYFWIIGYPLVSLLHTRRDLIRNALMAPAVGVVMTIYSTYALSRLGLPVGKFAQFLTIATLALAGLGWAWARPRLPARRLVPHVAIATLAFLATGWPLLAHGFAWFGQINPDMTYYVLGAHRLVDHAYQQGFDPEVWRNGTDWSIYFLVIENYGWRFGSELLIAWLIVLSGMNGVMVYMPLLITLNVILIAVSTSLISTPNRLARFLAAGLLAVSAMLTLGVVLQLTGQILGLMLLALGAALCLSAFYRLGLSAFWRFVMLAALVMATFLLTYPELLGFFGLAFLIYHGLTAVQLGGSVPRLLKGVLAIAVLSVVMLGPVFVANILEYVSTQVQLGTSAMRLPGLFPYFLIPSGLAALWGLVAYVPVDGGWLLAAIVCGIGLSLFGALATGWATARRETGAVVAAVMIVVAPLLFWTSNGFGALKLAMYAQPFLLPALSFATSRAVRSRSKLGSGRILALAVVLALAVANLRTQQHYVLNSAADRRDYEAMLDRLASIGLTAAGGPVMLDLPSVGIAQLAALYSRGRPTAAFVGDYGLGVTRRDHSNPISPAPHQKEVEAAVANLAAAYHSYRFPLDPEARESHVFRRFSFADNVKAHPAALVHPAANQSVINDSVIRPTNGRLYVSMLEDVRNYLVQIGTSLGHSMIPGEVDDIALWNWEPDNFNPTRGMQAMGRHLLFEVLNPVPDSRLLIDLTTSPLAATDVDLSPATVIGENRSNLGILGRGTARVVSGSIKPRNIGGHYYIAVDMGAEPRRVPYWRSGIAAAYNRDLNLDPRNIVGFARNISFVTEDQLNLLPPPTSIERFPDDLRMPGLLFAGVYEDGWMAEAAKFRLGADDRSNSIRIALQLPSYKALGAGAMADILVDGQSIARRRIDPGDLEWYIPMAPAAGPRWIELHVDKTERLPAPDGRLVSVRLMSISLEPSR